MMMMMMINALNRSTVCLNVLIGWILAALSQCSYVPKCERDNQKNKEKVLVWQDFWIYNISSQSFTCFFNQQRR